MKDSPAITIRTLEEETTPACRVVQFNLESLTTKEVFAVKYAVVISGFIIDECVLPSNGVTLFNGVTLIYWGNIVQSS